MTAKEKAKELVDKFSDATLAYDSGDHSAEGMNDSIMAMVNESKRCALIAVDEILKLKLWGKSNGISDRSYWQQVKSEITNL